MEKMKVENSLQELQCNCISLCSPSIGSLPEKQDQAGGCSPDFLIVRSHSKRSRGSIRMTFPAPLLDGKRGKKK